MTPGEITRLLTRWAEGASTAIRDLTPLVYDELRTVAGFYVRKGPLGATQATELVSELFSELLQMTNVRLEDRKHFFT